MKKYFLNHLNFSIVFMLLAWIVMLPVQLNSYKKEDFKSLKEQIKNGNDAGVQCSNFDLKNANLKGLNLKHANFTQANLKGANFSQSNLRGTIFFEAKAQKTNFSYSNLEKSNLIHANLNGANFRHANLTKANLENATINGAKFKGAQLKNAKYENVYSKKGCFLEDRSPKKTKMKAGNNKLDLHGKRPWESKSKEIEKFIKSAYKKSVQTVEIITGRGIHNPNKIMGIQWNSCKNYLLNQKFKPYIHGIQSQNKAGSWKVILKNPTINKAKTKKSTELILNDGYCEDPIFDN